nr:immunoglobulin heavy chain junction region [Mus musculus]MBK4197737.1 immunoglobulin heavy chain junction region [Mus musculus]MBK4197738.1 immunoglobulin heavy chain junction region [Mus musculus]MBK4197739.1 immunoglobulin heavy chain junction region [Mus musculus]
CARSGVYYYGVDYW